VSDKTEYPYDTRLNVRYRPLELIDLDAVATESDHQWFNQTLSKVNDSVVRMAVIQGEYHWHKHDNDDEFFYVVEGQLFIDFEDLTYALHPKQGMTVPKGTVHRTRALERTIILMVENEGIVPTGD